MTAIQCAAVCCLAEQAPLVLLARQCVRCCTVRAGLCRSVPLWALVELWGVARARTGVDNTTTSVKIISDPQTISCSSHAYALITFDQLRVEWWRVSLLRYCCVASTLSEMPWDLHRARAASAFGSRLLTLNMSCASIRSASASCAIAPSRTRRAQARGGPSLCPTRVGHRSPSRARQLALAPSCAR